MFIDCDYRFMIVSYENYYKNSDNFNKKCDLMIFDEGSVKICNGDGGRWWEKDEGWIKQQLLITAHSMRNNHGNGGILFSRVDSYRILCYCCLIKSLVDWVTGTISTQYPILKIGLTCYGWPIFFIQVKI